MSYLTEFAVYWGVVGVAIITSINARGALRISLSWFITLLLVFLGVFMASMKGNEFKQKLLDGAAADQIPVTETMLPPPESTPSKSQNTQEQGKTSAPPQVNNEELAKEYYDAASRIIGSALGCAGTIQAFDVENLGQLSDTRFEQEQSRALNLRNQAAALSRQVKALKAPNQFAYIHSELEKSTETLRMAGWAVHAFFGAENETEEASYSDQFRQYSRTAHTSLKTLQQELLRQR